MRMYPPPLRKPLPRLSKKPQQQSSNHQKKKTYDIYISLADEGSAIVIDGMKLKKQ